MLHLVEGLNCSGKSTWIYEQKASTIHTPWLNPLRWDKSDYRMGLDRQLWMQGAYDAIWYSYESGSFGTQMYWDRTFISAFAYGSLKREIFEQIIKVYKHFGVTIVFIDTPVDVCLDRMAVRNRKDPRNYIDLKKDWVQVRHNLVNAIQYMESKGFHIITEEYKC